MTTITASAPTTSRGDGATVRRTGRPATRQARHPSRAALRLTRRGRILRSVLVGLVLVAAVLVAAVAWGPGVVASSGHGDQAPVLTVTVQPGQTLWDIAAASGLGGDPRDVVARIQDLNALPDAGRLQVGQTVAVPLP